MFFIRIAHFSALRYTVPLEQTARENMQWNKERASVVFGKRRKRRKRRRA